MDQVKRMKDLELENQRLRKAVSDLKSDLILALDEKSYLRLALDERILAEAAKREDYPPIVWWTSKLTIEEIEREFPGYLAGKQYAGKFGKWQDGDELWRFSSPNEQWSALAGRAGFVHARRKAIGHIVTTLS